MKSKNRLNELIDLLETFKSFIERFRTLLNSHNVQFLVDNFWTDERLVENGIVQDLNRFLDQSVPNQTVNLIKYYHDFSQDLSDHSNPTELEKLFLEIINLKKLWNEKVLTPTSHFLNVQNICFDEAFDKIQKQNRFMNQKKVHEVDIMSKFVAKLCQDNDIETIVDIGSGRAYLSAQLSSTVFESAFNVIAIDSQSDYVESSLKRLSIMKKKTRMFSSTKGTNEETQKFQTFSQFIQSTSELNNLVEVHLKEVSLKNNKFALVGLHSCGNLSNSIVNLYVNNNPNEATSGDGCKLLCNVACCYNLLNEKYAETDCESHLDLKKTNVSIGDSSKFPMSSHLNNQKYSLHFNVRMLACHSFERLLSSLTDFRELHNTSLWYRCVLQEILIAKLNEYKLMDGIDPKTIKIGRKLINDKAISDSFVDYVRKALEKLNLFKDQMSDEEIEGYWIRNSADKSRFDAYIQLKTILSPIIEYVILLDRLIYLHEKENSAVNACAQEHYLVKLFDPVISPRCHAMLSLHSKA